MPPLLKERGTTQSGGEFLLAHQMVLFKPLAFRRGADTQCRGEVRAPGERQYPGIPLPFPGSFSDLCFFHPWISVFNRANQRLSLIRRGNPRCLLIDFFSIYILSSSALIRANPRLLDTREFSLIDRGGTPGGQGSPCTEPALSLAKGEPCDHHDTKTIPFWPLAPARSACALLLEIIGGNTRQRRTNRSIGSSLTLRLPPRHHRC